MVINPADQAAIQVLRYLEEKDLLKKGMIEGLSEHIPEISQIIDFEYVQERSIYLENCRAWIEDWSKNAHKEHEGNFLNCMKSICLSAKKTLNEF